jgi:hypothetical protein
MEKYIGGYPPRVVVEHLEEVVFSELRDDPVTKVRWSILAFLCGILMWSLFFLALTKIF